MIQKAVFAGVYLFAPDQRHFRNIAAWLKCRYTFENRHQKFLDPFALVVYRRDCSTGTLFLYGPFKQCQSVVEQIFPRSQIDLLHQFVQRVNLTAREAVVSQSRLIYTEDE